MRGPCPRPRRELLSSWCASPPRSPAYTPTVIEGGIWCNRDVASDLRGRSTGRLLVTGRVLGLWVDRCLQTEVLGCGGGAPRGLSGRPGRAGGSPGGWSQRWWSWCPRPSACRVNGAGVVGCTGAQRRSGPLRPAGPVTSRRDGEGRGHQLSRTTHSTQQPPPARCAVRTTGCTVPLLDQSLGRATRRGSAGAGGRRTGGQVAVGTSSVGAAAGGCAQRPAARVMAVR